MIRGDTMGKHINHQCNNFPDLQRGLNLIDAFQLQIRCQHSNQVVKSFRSHSIKLHAIVMTHFRYCSPHDALHIIPMCFLLRFHRCSPHNALHRIPLCFLLRFHPKCKWCVIFPQHEQPQQKHKKRSPWKVYS